MTASTIAAWLRQTSTILGISTIVGLVSAVLGGQMTWAAATPGILGAVAAILLPGQAPGQASGSVVVQQAASVAAETVALTPAPGSTTTVKAQ